MDFFLDIKYDSIDKEIEIMNNKIPFHGCNSCMFVSNKSSSLIWIGDLVVPEGYHSKKDYLEKLNNDFKIKDVLRAGGFFYCIRTIKRKNKIQILTSFLNILPVYYNLHNGGLFLSSNINSLYKKAQISPEVSKSFILEKMLFNYPFKNKTIFKKISMLPGNHYIEIDQNGFRLIEHTDILEWVVDKPLSVKKSINGLVEKFNNRVKSYLPDQEYYLSFTGGFDGRTILSVSLKNQMKFNTYSFGSKENDDIKIPLEQSRLLKIPYKPFYLDDQNYIKESLKAGLELMEITGSMSNFIRAHYVYAVKEISKTHNYMVTGNFGSEIFRAVHNTGVFVTPFLFGLFSAKNVQEFLEDYPYDELNYLNRDLFTNEIKVLKDEIISDYYFTQPQIEKNKIFYKYVFNEIFRKYFGAEIQMQNRYLFNRTPFLDYEIIKELFQTRLAGIYSNFYEHNPIKRFKGQLLYAHMIKENSDKLFYLKTGKGYSPSDLIHYWGKINLVKSFLKKRINRNSNQGDVFGVNQAIKYNMNEISKIPLNDDIFSKKSFQIAINGKIDNNMNFANAVSINWYLNKI